MHPSVVGATGIPVSAVIGVGIGIQIRIRHRPDRTVAADENIVSHQPVIGTGGIVFYRFAKNIGEGLVECAGFIAVGQIRGILCYTVGNFVTANVE